MTGRPSSGDYPEGALAELPDALAPPLRRDPAPLPVAFPGAAAGLIGLVGGASSRVCTPANACLGRPAGAKTCRIVSLIKKGAFGHVFPLPNSVGPGVRLCSSVRPEYWDSGELASCSHHVRFGLATPTVSPSESQTLFGGEGVAEVAGCATVPRGWPLRFQRVSRSAPARVQPSSATAWRHSSPGFRRAQSRPFPAPAV